MMTGSHKIKIQFGDCDPAGIVFYPNYFRWFDQCFNELLEAKGLAIGGLMARFGVVGLPLLEAGSKFMKSSTVGDVITVTTRVEEVAAKTVRVVHQVSGPDGEVRLEGWEVRIWAGPHPDDPKRLKAKKIPPEVWSVFLGG